MTEEFKEWYKEEYKHCFWRTQRGTSVLKVEKADFNELSWEMQWGIYQLYFWHTQSWWISIYPYTDKFGGNIKGLWDEGIATRNFITNVPSQAQEKIVEVAFEKLKEL